MTDLSGDASVPGRTQVIQLGGLASSGSAGHPATPGARGAGPAEKDLFARSGLAPSRRVLVVVLATVVLVVGGWFGVRTAIDQAHQRKEAKAVARYERATAAVQPLMSGYVFPASSHVVPRAARCFLESTCGTSASSPEQALTDVTPSLVARGVTVEDRSCRDDRQTRICSASLVLGGAPVGAVRAVRNEKLHVALGSPTAVSVDVAQMGAGSDGFPSPPTPMPADPTRVTVLPPDLMAHARCTRPVKGGCDAYVVDLRIEAAPGATWQRAGRYAVAHDWTPNGDCPQGPQHSCVLGAMRIDDDGGVSMTATFRPDPTRLQVHVDITALMGSSAVFGTRTPSGRVGHNGA